MRKELKTSGILDEMSSPETKNHAAKSKEIQKMQCCRKKRTKSACLAAGIWCINAMSK